MKIYSLPFLFAAALLSSSCQKEKSESESQSSDKKAEITVELLSHTKGKFAVAESRTLDPGQKGFSIGQKSFDIKKIWDDAEVKHETLNNNPRESHALELAWSVGDQSDSMWLFPIADASAAPMLKGTTVQPRLLPPGARMAVAEETKKSLLRGVQFEWQKKRYDISEVGQEVFAGWKVAAIKIYQHALRSEDGTITESTDTGFNNKVVEITIEARDGTKERHICFIDHPRLTAGIHPTILPVTRLSGDLASLSRLTVCETLKAPVEKSLIVVSPEIKGEGVNVWTWVKGAVSPQTQKINQFPTTLTLGDQKIELKQHWTKARRQIKWQQRKGAKEEDKQPALLIETGGHMHGKQFVLIKGKSTPCKVMGEILILRYK